MEFWQKGLILIAVIVIAPPFVKEIFEPFRPTPSYPWGREPIVIDSVKLTTSKTHIYSDGSGIFTVTYDVTGNPHVGTFTFLKVYVVPHYNDHLADYWIQKNVTVEFDPPDRTDSYFVYHFFDLSKVQIQGSSQLKEPGESTDFKVPAFLFGNETLEVGLWATMGVMASYIAYYDVTEVINGTTTVIPQIWDVPQTETWETVRVESPRSDESNRSFLGDLFLSGTFLGFGWLIIGVFIFILNRLNRKSSYNGKIMSD